MRRFIAEIFETDLCGVPGAHLGEKLRRFYANSKGDPHRELAARVFGVPPASVTPQQRNAVKCDVFSWIYSNSLTRDELAACIAVQREDAGRIRAQFRTRFPYLTRYFGVRAQGLSPSAASSPDKDSAEVSG